MFNKLFGRKSNETNNPPPKPALDPSKDPNMIRVQDEYGRELFITKQEWFNNVLLGNLDKEREHPEPLYNFLVSALQDGFGPRIIPYAEQLRRIDHGSVRSTAVLGIAYMEANRLDDAEKVLQGYTSEHGEDGLILTNLAKVYSRRGDQGRAEAILWHALELDPNLDNGLIWYAAMQKEREGEVAYWEAFRRVASLPGSWRARLWLARNALDHQDLPTAENLYHEALQLAGRPAPWDLLMQVSGDLGNHGHLELILSLVGPHFSPAIHGIQVGNNLIKASLDLGRVEEAYQLVQLLYQENRPDWKPTLSYWEKEIATARVNQQAAPPTTSLSLSLVAIQGPLWTRDGSPFASLLPTKPAGSVQIGLIGSTAVLDPSTSHEGLQLTDIPGRLSRAIPLKLSEYIHLSTDATGIGIIPKVKDNGFALFGQAYDDATLIKFATFGEQPSDFVAGLVVNTTQPVWELKMWLVRCADGQRLEEISYRGPVENIASLVEQLAETFRRWLANHAQVQLSQPPHWYGKIPERDESAYLVGLEQQLAVLCDHLEPVANYVLHNERDILDGALQLCVSQPQNARVRILYAQTLRQMKKVRPEIVTEFKEKTDRLQKNHPLGQEIELLLEKAYSEAFN